MTDPNFLNGEQYVTLFYILFIKVSWKKYHVSKKYKAEQHWLYQL